LDRASGRIVAASENCATFLGIPAESLLGQTIGLLFGTALEHELKVNYRPERNTLETLVFNGQEFVCRPHVNDTGQMLLDIEPITQNKAAHDLLYSCRQLLQDLRGMTESTAMTQEVVRQIRQITGYERVMIYRFDADWNGEVIAESCDVLLEPYLGLHFPASDIPKPARDFFLSSKIRLIPDIFYTPSALISKLDSQTIDLGLSSLRSVSPLHIEYLTSMHVKATLVGSLVIEGQLWGLLTCHHLSAPKYFNPVERDLLGWLYNDIAVLLETTLNRELRKLELKMRDLRNDEFMAMLAHELRNPLAPIRYAVHWLKKQEISSPLIKRNYDIIDSQASQMMRLINDLLEVSRITQGKISLTTEPLLINDIVQDALQSNRHLFEEKACSLETSLPPTPLWIQGDAVRLLQVLSNLLNNAAKYTDKKGRITLSLYQQGANVVIELTDTGIGIAAGDIEYIFEPFVQIKRNLTNAEYGLGLGLALARQLIEMHGGTLSAESPGIGFGSTFRIVLPAKASTNQASPSPYALQNPKFRILIVDDYVDVAQSLAQVFESEGHEVEVAYNGMEALEKAQLFCPQLMIIDIGLPDISGYDVAKRLRLFPETQAAILVAVSGFGQEKEQALAYAAGFNHHLLKPLDFQMLAIIVSTLA